VLGERTLVMGILNTTPDSFSDGGNFSDPNAAVARALEMVAQGADIIDIGGESTRPGADPVSAAEEIKRTIPIIDRIREQSDIPISIDTMKSEVAFRALDAGADIINDVSAGKAAPAMVDLAAQTSAGIILMHMKGSPKTMQNDPSYGNVVRETGTYLQSRAESAVKAGVDPSQIVIDPGIGFGKTTEHNLDLLRNLPALIKYDFPVLVGASRKRFIGELAGRGNTEDRLGGSLGVAAWANIQGAHILRVHDVLETCDVCRILDTLFRGDL